MAPIGKDTMSNAFRLWNNWFSVSSQMAMKSPVDVTYLADTVLLLRYFEAFGEVRRAISVLKKRTGRHENTIREFSIDNTGLKVGSPLDKFQGVLRGVPQYLGGQPDPKLE